jgi:hypothetical protein
MGSDDRSFVTTFFNGLRARDMGAVDRYMAPDFDFVARAPGGDPLGVDGMWGARRSRTTSNRGPLRQLCARQTGVVIDSEYALRIRVRDGLIVRFHLFENSYHVAAAFRRNGAWEIETSEGKRLVPPRGG